MAHLPNRAKKQTLKVLLLGDSGVGKTSLMNRFSTGKFTGQYKATIGADFLSKDIVLTMPQTGENKVCVLQIWDTAGQERFQSLGQGFYRGADACILVYDATNPDSFDNLEHWRTDFLDQVGGALNNLSLSFPFVVLGNKVDKVSSKAHILPANDQHNIPSVSLVVNSSDRARTALTHTYFQFNDRLVPRSKAEEWCMRVARDPGLSSSSDHLPHFETSAKSSINVEEAFLEAATLALVYQERKRLAQPQLFVPPTQKNLDLHKNSNSTSQMRNGCC